MKLRIATVIILLLSNQAIAGERSISMYAKGEATEEFKIQKCSDGEYAITSDMSALINEVKTTDPCSVLNHKSVGKGDLANARLNSEKSFANSDRPELSVVQYISLKGLSTGNAFNIMLVNPREDDLMALDEIRKCILMLKNGKQVKELKVSSAGQWKVNCHFE